MSEKHIDVVSNDEIQDALSILGVQIEKSEETNLEKDKEDQKKDDKSDNPADLIKSELEDLQAKLDAKKAELEVIEKAEEGKTTETEKKEDKIEKSEAGEEDNLISKALDEKFGAIATLLKANNDSLEGIKDIKSELELVKSENNSLKEQLSTVTDLVTKMANLSPGMKSVTNVSFLEKSNEDDLGDGKVLSLSGNKEKVQELLEKAYDSETNVLVQDEIGKSIISYNGGNGAIAKGILDNISKTNGITFVK